MKILTIGNFTTGWDGSICDEEHIAKALEGYGHEVVRWQREEVKLPITSNLLVPDYDFILIAQWDQYPALDTLKDVYRCPIVYWAFDYQENGQTWHLHLIDTADLYLSKRIADSKYTNWQWLPQDFAPMFLQPAPSVEKDIDVLFTGSYLPWATERNKTLAAIDKKFNLVIHSVNTWPDTFKDVRGPVMDDALPELIARARIVVSLDHTLEAGYWSDRVAQTLCCGGLVIHRYQPLCEQVFKSSVGYFYDIDGCLEYIENLLEMPEEDADLIRQVGYEYGDEFLRVDNRVNDLITIVQGIL